MDWTTIVLAIINILEGFGWLFDRRKHMQEVEGLKADNKQKEMNLAKTYVDEFKNNIAEPLRREVGGLRREIKHLRDAISKINDCPHAADCPVYDELQKHQTDNDRNDAEGGCA